MRIGFDEVLGLISDKTAISKKDITFDASFIPVDVNVGRNCSTWEAKNVCISDHDKILSPGLVVSIYAKGHEVLRFFAKDIEPRTNDIYDLMRVDCVQSCIGPGFYSFCPYLILDDKCDKKDIKTFIEVISFDPKTTEVDFYPKCSEYELSLKHKKFLQSLPSNSIKKSFFKDVEFAKGIHANSIKKAENERAL